MTSAHLGKDWKEGFERFKNQGGVVCFSCKVCKKAYYEWEFHEFKIHFLTESLREAEIKSKNRIRELEEGMRSIINNDKTEEYSYQPSSEKCKNNLELLPEQGHRWLTPREIAKKCLKSAEG